MIKIKLKIKNKGPAPYRRRKSSGAGFVILFAVTISSILLAIALGVSDIALKEIKFSTNARDTNDAFFAADTGIEYALFLDKSGNYDASPNQWEEIVGGLGSNGQSCFKVTIVKTTGSAVFTSKGYNTGGNVSGACTPGINSVERELRVSY